MRLPSRLLQRKPSAHKGDFGHVFILAGCSRFSGAAVICSWAAMRCGAGLVTLGIPCGLNEAMIKVKPKEVMTLPLPQTKKAALSFKAYRLIKEFIGRIDVLAIGPGLGEDNSTQGLVRKIILNADKPMVIDADALNALAGHLESVKVSRCQGVKEIILTPHPGEMSRLLGTTVKKVEDKRKEIARKFSRDYKLTLVLKGNQTIVADYKNNFYVNSTGNPGMATAGSGDVLTGMIAAFLGQGLDAFNAAKYAVYLHGLAGDLAAKEKTQIALIASDIINKIPAAIKKCS